MAEKNFINTGIFLFFMIVFAIVLVSPLKIGSSDGSHTGIVTAVEYNSNLIWGADSVYFKSSVESTQEDVYCVNEDFVKAQLINASKNGEEVIIYFKNDYFMWKWDCNGGQSIIYKIEGKK